MNAEQRALFEAWATKKLADSPLLYPLKTNPDGEYLWPVAQNMVDAWQACLAANAIDQPPADDERERLREAPTDLIYVACPYSHHDPAVRAERFGRANYYSARMMAAGLLVFSPISHTHPIALAGDLPKGWDFWERYDRAYLGICRALVVLCLPGWEQSKGVQAEIKIMDDLKRPVWYIQNYNNDCLEQTIAALGTREERG